MSLNQNLSPAHDGTDAQDATLPPSRVQGGIRAALAAVLLFSAIANVAASQFFPGQAPSQASSLESDGGLVGGLEQTFALITSVYVAIAAVVVGIFAALAGTRRSIPVRAGAISPLSAAGLVLSLVAGVGWLLLCVIPTLVEIGTTGRFEYLSMTGLVIVVAAPWLLGIVFSTLGLRAGRGRNLRVAGFGLAIGLLILESIVVASFLFAGGAADPDTTPPDSGRASSQSALVLSRA